MCPTCFLEIASSIFSLLEKLIDVCVYPCFAERIVRFEPSFRGQRGWTEPQIAFCCGNCVESSQEHSFAHTFRPTIRNRGPGSLFLLLSHLFLFAHPVRNDPLLYCDLDFEIKAWFGRTLRNNESHYVSFMFLCSVQLLLLSHIIICGHWHS